MRNQFLTFFVGLFALIIFQNAPAHAGEGVLGCWKRSCTLTFMTNAGWVQRAVVIGPVHVSGQGNGEGVTHLRRYVPRGNYTVRLIHNRGGRWRNSAVTYRGNCLNADDGGGRDRDFNDAIVCIY